MKSLSSSVRFSQLTRALVSQSNGIWSFNVFWCRFVTPLTDDHADCLHKHSSYEMHVAIDGGLRVDISNESPRLLHAGQFLLISPQTVHSVSFVTQESCKLVLAFSLQDMNKAIKKALSNSYCAVQETSPSISKIINALRPKLAESNVLTPYIISFLLQGVVLEALNIIAPDLLRTSTNRQESTLNGKRLEQANNIISSNILYPVSGQDLAQELNITVRHLNRLFSAAYGYSVNTQIQKMRISYAQHLLNTTTLSLADIAESMHYSSVYSFIRAFRNIAGIPPGKYRYGTIRNSESEGGSTAAVPHSQLEEKPS